MLQDSHGRQIGYLRLSLTRACAMRCTYCRPEKLGQPRGEWMLSVDQIEMLVRHLVKHHGLHKVRLTGGDPTSRSDLLQIIERVASISGINDLAMTTNGLTLLKHAHDYHNAGMQRVNISLDSLDATTFERMTGVAGLERVVAGLHKAIEVGLKPIRINTVVLAGENEDQLPGLVQFAAAMGLEIRFIELMPMGPLAEQWEQRFVSADLMQNIIDPIVHEWTALEQGHDSAHRYHVKLNDGREATIGFITPMSCNFCAACNRIRITAKGDIYPCLMDEPRGNIRKAWEPTFDGAMLDELLHEALSAKATEHPTSGFTTMTILGG